ncbi:hypothetical protein [Streptomyces sp. NPDC048590]|uniref:MmyB family transcriptional regulator n=1 Tax=Streptomyces sp. NPDC048590 TaxID=3365574 RepID=UPI003722A65E
MKGHRGPRQRIPQPSRRFPRSTSRSRPPRRTARRNHIRLTFLDSGGRALYACWEEVGRDCVSYLRKLPGFGRVDHSRVFGSGL